jgi:hypothetical protein
VSAQLIQCSADANGIARGRKVGALLVLDAGKSCDACTRGAADAGRWIDGAGRPALDAENGRLFDMAACGRQPIIMFWLSRECCEAGLTDDEPRFGRRSRMDDSR